MKPYFDEDGVQIFVGDCREILPQLNADSVQACVTSPPYWGLRDYQIEPQIWGGDPAHAHRWGDVVEVNATNHTDKRRWNHARNGRGEEQPDEKQVAWLRTKVAQGQFCACGAWLGSFGLEPDYRLFVEHAVEVFEHVRRVLKPDGTLWLNLGDSYATGAGKACSPGGGAQGENFTGPRGYRGGHADSPKHSAGSLASDGFQPNRMPQPGLKPKDLCGIPWRVAFALQEAGWWLRQDIIWSKPNPMPESVTDRCTKAHEYLFLMAKSERYYFDADAIKEPAVSGDPRKPYAPGQVDQRGDGHARGGGKVRESVKRGGFNGKTEALDGRNAFRAIEDYRNKRSVWTINTEPFSEAHFATFPTALVEPCIKAGSSAGGIILDPFGGSGTTALVTRRLGCKAILIELNEEYAEMAARRLSQFVFQF